ncbi:MAG TPA: prephenate dehydrogenase [Terriglobales bacterium]|nr:prephenate dehydrogenase [Terriglobales bacterium]
MFKQITIIGTGLIGGSLALAAKKDKLVGRVVGCDRAETLEHAQKMGAIDSGSSDPAQASAGSQAVVLATPVGAILDFVERIAPRLPPDVLVTDVGSTKKEMVERARAALGEEAGRRILPGHPMAGKERSGLEQADAELFLGTVWLFTPMGGSETRPQGRAGEWVTLVEKLGAKALFMDVERHDRLCAWISHLPQMISTALASTLEDQVGDDAEIKAIGGRALREMTRIAASPYSMWRDIAMTNTGNLEEALLRLEQKLAYIRENLKTAGLREEFERGNKFHR